MKAGGANALVPQLTVRTHLLTIAQGGVLGSVAIDAPDIAIPSVSSLSRLVPLPNGVAVDRGSARGSVLLDVDVGEGNATGTVRLGSRDLGLHLGGQAMHGDLEVALYAKREEGRTDLSGSVLQFREAQNGGWWARVDLSDAVASIRGGTRIRAQVIVHAKDASPITSFVESQANVFAGFAIGAIPSTSLAASGLLTVSPATVEMRSFRAQAEGFDLSFEFANLEQTRVRLLLLSVGPVRAGVDMTDGQEQGRPSLAPGARVWAERVRIFCGNGRAVTSEESAERLHGRRCFDVAAKGRCDELYGGLGGRHETELAVVIQRLRRVVFRPDVGASAVRDDGLAVDVRRGQRRDRYSTRLELRDGGLLTRGFRDDGYDTANLGSALSRAKRGHKLRIAQLLHFEVEGLRRASNQTEKTWSRRHGGHEKRSRWRVRGGP